MISSPFHHGDTKNTEKAPGNFKLNEYTLWDLLDKLKFVGHLR